MRAIPKNGTKLLHPAPANGTGTAGLGSTACSEYGTLIPQMGTLIGNESPIGNCGRDWYSTNSDSGASAVIQFDIAIRGQLQFGQFNIETSVLGLMPLSGCDDPPLCGLHERVKTEWVSITSCPCRAELFKPVFAPPFHMCGVGVVDALPSRWRLPSARTDAPPTAARADEVPKAPRAVQCLRIVDDHVMAQNLAPMPGLPTVRMMSPGSSLIFLRTFILLLLTGTLTRLLPFRRRPCGCVGASTCTKGAGPPLLENRRA